MRIETENGWYEVNTWKELKRLIDNLVARVTEAPDIMLAPHNGHTLKVGIGRDGFNPYLLMLPNDPPDCTCPDWTNGRLADRCPIHGRAGML